MAKKKPVKKKPAKAFKAAKLAKVAKSAPPQAAANSAALVLFTLRESGASALRFHSDHADLERARATARVLASSMDIADAFVIRADEIFHGGAV